VSVFETMITRVPHGVLRSRIDSAFYAPEHLERERRMRQLGVARPAIGQMASLVTDGTHKTPTYIQSGVPFLSATNIGGGALIFEDHKFISRPEFLLLRAWNCAPMPNDVVVAKSGSIGNAAVVPAHAPEFAVFESVAIVRCERVDPYYLATFLNSVVGQKEIRRQTKGAVIRHLHLEDLREVEIPEFSEQAQRYIGDKLRQAERLRERARILDAMSKDVLTEALGESDESWVSGAGPTGLIPSGGFRTRVIAAHLRGRLDPGGYHPELTAISNRAATSPGFVSLAEVADLVTDTRERTSAKYAPNAYISILHVLSGGYIDMIAAGVHQPESDGRVCAPGDVLLSGINPAANRIAVCPEPSGRVACSPEFSILRVRPSVDPHFLAFALRSQVCLRQLLHLGQGTSSSRRRIDEAELSALWVPICPQQQRVGAWMATRQACIAASFALTHAAGIIVGLLMEGRIADADLTDAQKALETGNRSADRSILQALLLGDDSDAKPLIPDLDGLYALLDEQAEERD
jgi:type I restriction enzyme S subunit